MKKKNANNKTRIKRGILLKTTILLLLVVAIGLGFYPLFNNLNFGLDLQGGFEVLYQVESIDGSKMSKDKINATYKTLSKRIDSLGVTEPEIIIEGTDKIRVKLAGVKNQEEARTQLSTVATLSFRDTNDKLLMSSDVLKAGGAKITQDANGKPAVLLSVKNKNEFYKQTNKISKTKNNNIVIWLDFEEGMDSFTTEQNSCGTTGSKCLSAATVSQGFASDVIIQGNFTEDEVSNLVDLINSGSLPSKLTEVSSKTVGASFGDATLSKTLYAGIIGVVAIIIMLVLIYRFSGVISSVSMLIYTFLVFLVFWTIGGVLTLPGIAALVLGIGMAVDANVLTFARIKEELYSGRSVEQAFVLGSKASLGTIIDSNLTTLLVAIIMFIFGESSVKGFSTMLIITILVTMFTMVFLTRVIMKIFVKTKYFDDKPNLFIGVKQTDIPDVSKNEKVKVIPFKNVNFLKHAKKLIALSLVIILAGGVVFGFKGLNLGIDFQAGSEITLQTIKKITNEELTKDLEELSLNQSDMNINSNEVSIRVKDTLEKGKVEEVTRYFESKYEAKVDIGVVSNIVKEELIKNAFISLLFAMIGIIIYIAVRFKFSYAVSAVIALIHDVFIMVALFSIFHLEITTMFIAAVLAIIGYSINDTIVSFDRIKENLKKENNKKMTYERFKEICNISIRETFTRTIYTSITTILPVIALIFLGSGEILNFNLAMLFGLISGTYSSIFIATLLFVILEKKNLGRESQKKVYKDDLEEKQIKGINC